MLHRGEDYKSCMNRIAQHGCQ
ncbi:hypothetical protein RSAG8_02352, partial [Rhizoctonia solani AG-8 WAC10335]